MASASDKKATLVAAVERALNKGISLERALDIETGNEGMGYNSVEVHRVENLVIQVKVAWDHRTAPSYYTVKVAEPW